MLWRYAHVRSDRLSTEITNIVNSCSSLHVEAPPANRPDCYTVSKMSAYKNQFTYKNEECVDTQISRTCLLFGACLGLLNIERPDFGCGAETSVFNKYFRLSLDRSSSEPTVSASWWSAVYCQTDKDRITRNRDKSCLTFSELPGLQDMVEV
jgi:hypothetical protein